MDALKVQALAVASTLGKVRPDRGNRYETYTARTLGAGAYANWQETCRTMAYLLCVQSKVLSEADFYAACDYDKETR